MVQETRTKKVCRIDDIVGFNVLIQFYPYAYNSYYMPIVLPLL